MYHVSSIAYRILHITYYTYYTYYTYTGSPDFKILVQARIANIIIILISVQNYLWGGQAHISIRTTYYVLRSTYYVVRIM